MSDLCRCGHSVDDHFEKSGECLARYCTCSIYGTRGTASSRFPESTYPERASTRGTPDFCGGSPNSLRAHAYVDGVCKCCPRETPIGVDVSKWELAAP